MILRTSAVALCCSSASSRSRVSYAKRLGACLAFCALRRFAVALRRRDLAGWTLAAERRRIAFLKAQDQANCGLERSDYSRDLRPAKWGSMINLRCKNPETAGTAAGGES